MAWLYDVTVRGIRYVQGSVIALQSNASAYTSCDKASASTTYYTTDTVWFHGKVVGVDYAKHPYAVSRKRPGQPDYYIDEAHFPYLTSTVSFHANGGSGAPGAQTKVWGTILTLSSTRPTRTGYTFLGWSTSSTATSATYGAGGLYGADVSVTLYAVWSINKYRVTYNANGGSCATAHTDCNYNSYATHPTPTRVGYTFKGWYTDSVGGTRHLGGSNAITGNITLYAQWTPNEYVLTLDPNGGSINGHTSMFSPSPNLTYNAGSWSQLPAGSRVGYTFLGYYNATSGGVKVYDASGAYVNNTVYWKNGAYIYPGHVTFYARWAANSYSFTLKLCNGSEDSTRSVTYGDKITLVTPSRTGYTFMGWDVQGEATMSGNTLIIGASDVTVIATWTIKTFVVTFNATANGGDNNETRGYNYGDRLGSLPVATKKYYKFIGWFTTPDDGGTQATEQDVITSNITLYARYVLETTLAVAVDGKYNPAIPYMYFNDEWQQGITYVYKDGEWQQGIGGA